MARIIALFVSTLAAVLLSACSVPSPLPPQATPAGSPQATVSAPAETPAKALGTVRSVFGRYAAQTAEGLFFVQADSVARLQGAAQQTLFRLPQDGAVENLFVCHDRIFISLRLDSATPQGDRALYRADKAADGYAISAMGLVNGPVLAYGNTLYFLRSGDLTAYDCVGGTSKSIATLGKNTELFHWDFFDGTTLYYSVYDEQQEDTGVLFGPSTLHRLNLSTGETQSVGERNRPQADALLFDEDGVLYRLSPAGGGYTLRILNSAQGAIDTDYFLPSSVLPNGPGAQRIAVTTDGLWLLSLWGDEANRTRIAAYALTGGSRLDSPAYEVLLPQSAASVAIDRLSQEFFVLGESSPEKSPTLYRIRLRDGAIIRQMTVNDKNPAIKEILPAADRVLIYALLGEDNPRPSLLFLQ